VFNHTTEKVVGRLRRRSGRGSTSRGEARPNLFAGVAGTRQRQLQLRQCLDEQASHREHEQDEERVVGGRTDGEDDEGGRVGGRTDGEDDEGGIVGGRTDDDENEGGDAQLEAELVGRNSSPVSAAGSSMRTIRYTNC
jgi:ATP-dependent RNA helicase DeaD